MADDNPCNPLQESTATGQLEEGEELVLLFLDSFHGYLMLLETLSSTLRQGWLEIASARHSMGPSRLSGVLLDLKVQSAATTVMLNELVEESGPVLQPQFTLSKWTCLEERKTSPKKLVDGSLLKDCNSSGLRQRSPKHVFDGTLESTAVDENVRALSLSKNSLTTSESVDENVRALSFSKYSSTTSEAVDQNKRRYKSLSVFGALVSPKLRAAQVSFETALEIIVEIANMRSSILSSFAQLQKNNKCSD